MAAGTNTVFSKGYVVEGTSALVAGTALTDGAADQSCANVTASTQFVLGVNEYAIDADKVATGKAVATVAIIGIARVLLAGTVAKRDPLTIDNTGKWVKQATAGGKFYAIAEDAGVSGKLIKARVFGTYATI